MQYFTGRFQGHIPILSTDKKQAYDCISKTDAGHIATLLYNMYGGKEWHVTIESRTDDLTSLTLQHIYICR